MSLPEQSTPARAAGPDAIAFVSSYDDKHQLAALHGRLIE